jgi:hypothetical protein
MQAVVGQESPFDHGSQRHPGLALLLFRRTLRGLPGGAPGSLISTSTSRTRLVRTILGFSTRNSLALKGLNRLGRPAVDRLEPFSRFRH